ncbi:MAG: type I-E CRISPR-associated protein Cas5/CasD [Deltaproteobacteria bacterium]|nr:type I-E CRISPR-associated protein Cas5/CasD [Deltaproteobacteria bacterium]
MKTVLLRLEGPLQSWGTESRFGHRDTQREPSKSGVLGLVGAALGMPRDDDQTVARLAAARMAVRVDREGAVLSDYHTAGGGTYRGEPHSVFGAKNPVLTTRHYLSSASFLAALSFDDEPFGARVHEALGSPRWELTLGRRACPPSVPVQAGIVGEDAEEALRRAVFEAESPTKSPLRLVVECAPSADGSEPRQDQPISFRLHHRAFARRWVRTAWIEPSELTTRPSQVSIVGILGG